MVKKRDKKQKQAQPKELAKEVIKDQPKPETPIENIENTLKPEQPKEVPKPQEQTQEALMIQVSGFIETDIVMLECNCTVCGGKMKWPVPKTIGQSVMYITGCKACGGM